MPVMDEVYTVVCQLRVSKGGEALNPKCCRGFTIAKNDWEARRPECEHCGVTMKVIGSYKEFDL